MRVPTTEHFISSCVADDKWFALLKYIRNFNTETSHFSYLDSSLVQKRRILLILIWEFKKIFFRMEAGNGAYDLLQPTVPLYCIYTEWPIKMYTLFTHQYLWINLNEISISGWECNIMFSQQMAQALF